MPGKRAEGVRVRNVAVHDDLWEAAKARADADGISVSEVIRQALTAYVRGTLMARP